MRCSLSLGLGLFVFALAGCTAEVGEDAAALDGAPDESAIVGGQATREREEVALVDIDLGNDKWASCSGALIAPRVVLTAGHCVAGFTRFRVTLPYARDARPVPSTGAAVYDYPSGGGTVVRERHDVGLVFLDRPVALRRYPRLARTAVPNGTLAVNVGRKRDGQSAGAELFASKPVALEDATFRGSPHAYSAERVIEKGDSGGPAYLPDASPPVIVGVASGTGQGYQLVARVDLLAAWIDGQVAGHGGAALVGAGACDGTPEVEPNDTATRASAVGASACGTLDGPGDVDWFTFRADGAGVRAAVRLEGDAELRLWRQAGKFWQPVAGAPTAVDVLSAGDERYAIEVRGARAAGVPYKLTVAR